MSKSIFSFVLLLLVSNVQAQFSIGIPTWGGQFSNFTKEVGAYTDPQYRRYKNKMYDGLVTGVSVRYKFKTLYFFQSELLYSMRGESYRYTATELDGHSIFDLYGGDENSIEYYLDYKVDYFEIPMLIGLNITESLEEELPAHFSLSTGLSVGFNSNSSLRQNYYWIKSPNSTWSDIGEDVHSYPVNNTRKLILNVVGNFEAEFWRHRKAQMFVYVRYSRSLTSVFKTDEMKTKLVTLGLGLGFRWRLNSSHRDKTS